MNINFTASYPLDEIKDLQNYLKFPKKWNGITINFSHSGYYVNIWFSHNSFVLEVDNDNEFEAPAIYKELNNSFEVVSALEKFFKDVDNKK